jgi:hypothetical protein
VRTRGVDPRSERSGSRPPTILAGDYSARATPVPIPNTVVKPRSADGTAGATRWESTTSPACSSDEPCSASARVRALLRTKLPHGRESEGAGGREQPQQTTALTRRTRRTDRSPAEVTGRSALPVGAALSGSGGLRVCCSTTPTEWWRWDEGYRWPAMSRYRNRSAASPSPFSETSAFEMLLLITQAQVPLRCRPPGQ